MFHVKPSLHRTPRCLQAELAERINGLIEQMKKDRKTERERDDTEQT